MPPSTTYKIPQLLEELGALLPAERFAALESVDWWRDGGIVFVHLRFTSPPFDVIRSGCDLNDNLQRPRGKDADTHLAFELRAKFRRKFLDEAEPADFPKKTPVQRLKEAGEIV